MVLVHVSKHHFQEFKPDYLWQHNCPKLVSLSPNPFVLNDQRILEIVRIFTFEKRKRIVS